MYNQVRGTGRYNLKNVWHKQSSSLYLIKYELINMYNDTVYSEYSIMGLLFIHPKNDILIYIIM